MAHQRFRHFDASTGTERCMAVRAGEHVVLRGQGGYTPEGGFTGLGDPAAQADQAMRTIRVLLAEAGARMADIGKITTTVTDRAWCHPVETVVARHLAGLTPARTGVIVNGLATPEMLVAIDVEAAVQKTGLFLPGLTDPAASATVRRHGHGAEAAAEQAEAVFAALHDRLARAGSSGLDVCKLTMQITDRAYRQGVYRVLGQRLAGIWPVCTGLIVGGLPDPDALFQLDAYAMPGGPHERFRRYRSDAMAYGLQTQSFAMDFCMAVRAGKRIFLRGQTGMTIGGELVGLNDAGAQAAQAIQSVRTLLADAGADLSHATRLVIYVTDRAYLGPVRAAVEPAFADAPVASTELVVKGLAAPELLMEIDVHAALP